MTDTIDHTNGDKKGAQEAAATGRDTKNAANTKQTVQPDMKDARNKKVNSKGET